MTIDAMPELVDLRAAMRGRALLTNARAVPT